MCCGIEVRGLLALCGKLEAVSRRRLGVVNGFLLGDSNCDWVPAWPKRGPLLRCGVPCTRKGLGAEGSSSRFLTAECAIDVMKGERASTGPCLLSYSKSMGVNDSRWLPRDILLGKEAEGSHGWLWG